MLANRVFLNSDLRQSGGGCEARETATTVGSIASYLGIGPTAIVSPLKLGVWRGQNRIFIGLPVEVSTGVRGFHAVNSLPPSLHGQITVRHNVPSEGIEIRHGTLPASVPSSLYWLHSLKTELTMAARPQWLVDRMNCGFSSRSVTLADVSNTAGAVNFIVHNCIIPSPKS
jgi:hypothetical protein